MKSLLFRATLVAFLFFGHQLLLAQEKFKEEEVNDLLVEEINSFREKNNLKPLQRDDVLDAAAFDQASYIIANGGKVVHEQDKEKKKTLPDRIIYYGGLQAEAGENATIIGLGTKEKIELKGERVQIDTDQKLVRAAVISWLEEEEGKLNLLDPEFYQLGTSVIIDENNKYILLAVFASLPYQLPDNRKPKLNFFGIKPYDKEKCDPFLENHPTLPQLFSDAIRVEGQEAYFTYHSLPYIEEILSGGSDGIALDLILKNQYACETGNRLFPTEINDGYLFPPVRKAQLYSSNLLKEKGEVKLKLASLPDFYEAETSELNLLIIKDGHYCQTVPFNNLQTEHSNWLEIPYIYSGMSDTTGIEWNDTTKITVEKTDHWQKDIENYIERLKELNYEFSAISVNQKTIPNRTMIEEEQITALIKSLIASEVLEVNYQEEMNWKDFDAFKEGKIYGVETEGMDREAQLAYLIKNEAEDTLLAGFINRSDRLEFIFTGHARLSEGIDWEKKRILFKWLFKQNKLDKALYLQANILKQLKEGEVQAENFERLDPHQRKENLPFISNQIALASDLGEKEYESNLIHIAFLELYLINKNDKNIKYNTYLSQLKYWSERPSEIKNLGEWAESFISLSNGKIPKEIYSRAMLNYNLISTDYYYDKGNFNDRKKAIDGVMKWHHKSGLDHKEYLQLVQYLVYQDQLPNAIHILLQLDKADQLNQDLLFYLLQIGIYDEQSLPYEKYLVLLEKAQEQYPAVFCTLFSKQKMGVQRLKDSEIKALYCKHCMDK